MIDSMEENKYKSSVKKDFSTKLISLFVALVISLINVIMKVMIKLMAKKFIKSLSITHQHLFIAKKLWKMQFVNMAIIPLLISASTLNFLSQGGLTDELMLIFALNAIVPHFVNIFFEIDVYERIAKNWLLSRFMDRTKRYEKDPNDKEAVKDMIKGPIFTQSEANEIVLGLELDISDHYAYVFSSLGIAMFYFSIFPLGLLFCVVGLIGMYWVSKYIVVKRCHKLVRYSKDISLLLLGELELCVVFYSVKIIFFFSNFNNGKFFVKIF